MKVKEEIDANFHPHADGQRRDGGEEKEVLRVSESENRFHEVVNVANLACGCWMEDR